MLYVVLGFASGWSSGAGTASLGDPLFAGASLRYELDFNPIRMIGVELIIFFLTLLYQLLMGP